MRRKISFILGIALLFFMSINVYAAETIVISNQDDYFNAIQTIYASSEDEFVISLDDDIILTSYPPTANPVLISNDKTVTILGNNHKIKISDTGSYGYNSIIIVGNATVNLGNVDGDKLYIEGGGPTVSTSESLIHVSGTVNMYDGVEIGDNHSGYGGLNGGAFRIGVNGTVNMYGGRIHDNSNTSNCLGGAVMLDAKNGTFNMYDGIFEDNSTCKNYGAYGGAILINDYATQTATVNIEGGTFKNNSSYFGGAIANIFGKLTIKNATFEGNTASATTVGPEEAAGGAVIQYSSIAANIEKSTFINNMSQSGSAIYVYGGRLNLAESTLKDNVATLNGGAVNVGEYGTFVSEENRYENNTAKNGGAIYNGKILYSFDDTIVENRAEVGGGIYANGTRNMMDAIIYNNKASTAANDVYISSTATNITLKDASTIADAVVTFGNKSISVNAWLEDKEDDRYSPTNITNVIAHDEISSGNEYFLTAANDKEINIVKFILDGVSLNDKQVEKGNKLEVFENPTKDGYNFDGWYIDSDYESKFDFDTEISSDITLYGRWLYIYKILSGADQTYDSNDLNIVTNGDMNKLVEIKINGEVLNQSNYTIEGENTKLILKSQYLETLNPGTYTITFVYTDGSIGTNFVIKSTSNRVTDTEINAPNTGDNILKYVYMLLLSISGLTIVLYNKRFS